MRDGILSRWARQWAIVAVWGTVVLACARNPVTGERELALISEAQEIEMGRQAAQQTEQSLGLVQDEELQNYIQRIGAQLAADSERPELPWRFRVVDDPTPNAFALPGGFIYVTRGMMSLMESEAELASVLGHEIGHVTARHSVNQMSRAQVASLGLGIGMIFVEELQQYGDLASTGLQLLFLKYGRDDERQADDLGFKYALQEGYDVREMADVFQALQTIGESSGQSPLPTWMSSHPDPGERVSRTQQRIQALGSVTLDTLEAGREQYLAQIDGLIYGQNPRNGFFRNATFYHPDLRFSMTFPNGWPAQNLPQAVVAVSPNKDAAIELTLAQGSSPSAAASAFLNQQGIAAGQTVQQQVNGIPAIASTFQAQTEQGVVQGLAAFLEHGGRVYQVIGYTPQQQYGAYDSAFRGALGSFDAVTDPSILNVQPNRVDVVRVPRTQTLAEFNRQNPSAIPIAEAALINQLSGPSATIQQGAMIKVVRAG
jgi:predicted Zn-dependent protease